MSRIATVVTIELTFPHEAAQSAIACPERRLRLRKQAGWSGAPFGGAAAQFAAPQRVWVSIYFLLIFMFCSRYIGEDLGPPEAASHAYVCSSPPHSAQ